MITTILERQNVGARAVVLATALVLILFGAPESGAQEILIGGRIEPAVGWISGSDWADAIDYWDDNFSGEPHKPRLSFSGGAVCAFGAEIRYTRQLTDTTEDFNARQNSVGLGLSYLQRVK